MNEIKSRMKKKERIKMQEAIIKKKKQAQSFKTKQQEVLLLGNTLRLLISEY